MVTREANCSHDVLLQDEVVIKGLDAMVDTIEDIFAHSKMTVKLSVKRASGAK